MKQREKAVYTKRVTVRFKPTEFERLETEFRKTTCRKFSHYLRQIMLAKPVTILHRNASADAFLTEMVGLKNELSAIGKNFNQSVKKLHSFDHLETIKTWATLNENSKQILEQKVEEIREKLYQIYAQWSQK